METNNILKVRAKVLHPKDVLCINSQCQDGEWVYGELHLQAHVPHIHIDIRRKEPIDVTTIGRFIGMCDKNGFEIYEGDIVVRKDLTFNDEKVCVVVYNSEIACFRLHYENSVYTERYPFISSDSYNDGQCTIDCKYEYEVIGNIYDNPRKLKKI